MGTEDFGTHTKITNHSYTGSEPPVVYLDNKGEYHTGRCETYVERNGTDYSNPYWLNEVMTEYDFCSMCFPPEVIENYKKAYDIMAETISPK